MKKKISRSRKTLRTVLLILLIIAVTFAVLSSIHRKKFEKEYQKNDNFWREYYKWRAIIGGHFPHIKKYQDFEKAISENKFVLFELSQRGCYSCIGAYKNIFEMSSKDVFTNVKFYYINMNEINRNDLKKILKENNIKLKAIPLIMLFKNGKLFRERIGNNSQLKKILIKWIYDAKRMDTDE